VDMWTSQSDATIRGPTTATTNRQNVLNKASNVLDVSERLSLDVSAQTAAGLSGKQLGCNSAAPRQPCACGEALGGGTTAGPKRRDCGPRLPRRLPFKEGKERVPGSNGHSRCASQNRCGREQLIGAALAGVSRCSRSGRSPLSTSQAGRGSRGRATAWHCSQNDCSELY
jgi:hypothetical protein